MDIDLDMDIDPDLDIDMDMDTDPDLDTDPVIDTGRHSYININNGIIAQTSEFPRFEQLFHC